MRTLDSSEAKTVSGGTGACQSSGEGSDYGGVTGPGSLGAELCGAYTSLVEAATDLFEQIADAFED